MGSLLMAYHSNNDATIGSIAQERTVMFGLSLTSVR